MDGPCCHRGRNNIPDKLSPGEQWPIAWSFAHEVLRFAKVGSEGRTTGHSNGRTTLCAE
jgi:hypothetical protein